MFEVIETKGKPIKAWIVGVPVEDAARQQLINVAALPFIYSHGNTDLLFHVRDDKHDGNFDIYVSAQGK